MSGERLSLRHASILDHLVFVIHIGPDAAVLIRVRKTSRRVFKVLDVRPQPRASFLARNSAKPLR